MTTLYNVRATVRDPIVSLLRWVDQWPYRLRMVLILLVSTFLSLWRLDAADLMLDEGISYWIAHKPPLEVLAYSASRAWEHPPLYYLMLHGWMRIFGESEFALRALSWFGITIAVTIIATVVKRWFDARIALLAALIVATSPMIVRYARDARMYPWLMALIPLSVYLLDRALRRDRWRDWALFFAAIVLAIAMHYLVGLVLLAYVLFLAISWRKLPASRARFAQLLGLLIVLGLAGMLLPSGPRASIVEGIDLLRRMPRTLAPLWEICAEWALGSNAQELPRIVVMPLTVFVWGLALGGMFVSKRLSPRSSLDLRLLFIFLILLPSLVAVLVMPFSNPRHTSSTVGLFLTAAVMGIVFAARRSRWVGRGLLFLLLFLNLAMSVRHIVEGRRPFADPLDYINARARDGEPLVYTYYFDWPLDSYYNHRALPYFNVVPERHQEVDEAVIQERAADVTATGAPSLWLMLFPGPDNTDRAERAFNALAFPAERIWFTSGRSVIRYFAPRTLTEQSGDLNWGDQMRLTQWGVDSQTLQAGDAFRLQFQWQRLLPIDKSYLFALTLVAPDGSIWASRATVPCNGRCSTEAWTDVPVTDKLAFYVPADVPPGDYDLHIAWLTADGVPLVGRSSRDSAGRVDLPLMKVRIDPPSGAAPAIPPLDKPIGASLRAGLTLRSVEFSDPVTRAGVMLVIPLQLTISVPQPELEIQLRLERAGKGVTVAQPLAPTWHSSTIWVPGRTLRVQPRFVIPGTLSPGEYKARLTVAVPGAEATGASLPIGVVRVEERPRLFTVPERGLILGVGCEQGINLARFDLPQSALPGSAVPVTLIWQSDGPAQRNWKVYIHVRDAQDITVTQVDGYPAMGTALTTSWMPGEVVVDVHSLFLPGDLPAMDYAVRVGFYDESSFERLRCGDGDGITLPMRLRVGR